MSLLTDFARLRRLSPAERRIFIHVVVLLTVIGVGLRLVGMRRVQALLEPVKPVFHADVLPLDAQKQASQIARMVAIAARRGPYKANCLPTSLALRRMLQLKGFPADLRVGVRKTNGLLEAHAWVEHQGRPLIDSVDVHERFPAFGQPIHPSENILK